MKNLIKLTFVSSLLIIASLLLSACGGDAENFVQGNGKVTVTAQNSVGVKLANVKIEAHFDNPTGDIKETATTDVNGAHDFQLTVGSGYYFTFTDQNVPARFAPYNDPTKITPELTNTKTLNTTLPFGPA
jgi:hypothetical protein